MKPATNKTSDVGRLRKHLGITIGMLLFVIKGLRNGSIRSRPILNIDKCAKEYGMTTLEDEIWVALNKCGIKEAKQPNAPAKSKKTGAAK